MIVIANRWHGCNHSAAIKLSSGFISALSAVSTSSGAASGSKEMS